jgi:hypothetical protein
MATNKAMTPIMKMTQMIKLMLKRMISPTALEKTTITKNKIPMQVQNKAKTTSKTLPVRRYL